MLLQKNDYITVEIIDISSSGEGIGKIDGFALFVKDAVIGDLVEVKIMKIKKTYGYARLNRIIKPSPNRIEAKCPVARSCGGCQIQEMKYSAQLAFKQNLVQNNLLRLGGITDYVMEPIIGMNEPFSFRNKAQYPVGKDKDGKIVIGFYAGHSHTIVNNLDCCIGDSRNAGILANIREFMVKNHIEPYDESEHRGLVRHILIRNGRATGQVMVCLVLNGKKLPKSDKLVEILRDTEGIYSIMININESKTNVIMGKDSEVLWGKGYIEDTIGDVQFQISPLSFFQVNPEQTEKLYEKALSFAGLTGEEIVWDLYCGIGTISLFLAQKAKKVYGVEIVPEAIADANRNAQLNGIENVQFFVGKSEEVLPEYYAIHKTEYADVIVVDPPRKGCDQVLLETIIQMAPSRVVYVSCDSATLARDLKFMQQNGYRVERVQAVDQFGHSVHVETIALLCRDNEH